jgi:hypothetical protein
MPVFLLTTFLSLATRWTLKSSLRTVTKTDVLWDSEKGVVIVIKSVSQQNIYNYNVYQVLDILKVLVHQEKSQALSDYHLIGELRPPKQNFLFLVRIFFQVLDVRGLFIFIF